MSTSPGVVYVDAAELSGRCMNQPKLVSTVLRVFCDGLRKHAQVIADAHAAGQWATLAQAAHTVKGSALNVAAKPLAATVTELENAAKAGDAARCGELARTFAELVPPTLEAATAIVQTGNGQQRAAA
jgi:HPt (histidine-containing phosphotransfer) domain-containing protein